MADPLEFSDLYGSNGLGFLVGDIQSGSVTDRKVAVNDAYIEMASIKGYWRKRSSDYTSSSSPALTDATRIYNAPSDFDSAYRIGYRRNGRYIDIEIIGDEEWLKRSATQSSDKGDPDYARIVYDGSNFRIEFNRAVSQTFISQIGTITLEYFIRITRLSADGDTPILPANYRHYIKYLAAKIYAIGQNDKDLFAMLDQNGVLSMAEKGKAMLLKHDLTRTGRPRQLRPKEGYEPKQSESYADYGSDNYR